MGVRVYYSGSFFNGGHRGLIGPDADGKIKLPSSRSNLFIREGTCGSAPLYHQERKSQYELYGDVKVSCYYDDDDTGDSIKLVTVSRGTWAMVARYRWGEADCWYYYSKNGMLITENRGCSYYSDEKQEFYKVITSKTLPAEQKVKQCWSLCTTAYQVYNTWYCGIWSFGYGITDAEVIPKNCALSRKYLDFWELATETGVVMPPSDLQLCLSKASEDLAASLPQTPINIAEALVDLVSVKNISKAFRTSEKVSAMLADSWLKWRYVYTTTKLDVRSMREFLNRGLSLFDGTTKKDYSCHGYAHMGDLTCRCSTTLLGRDLKEQFRRASQSLHTYDLWDLVPWSFVVDWFIPIGSMLQNLEYQGNLLKLDHGTIWYTCEWYEDSASENFMRFCTNQFVTTPCSIFHNKGPTNKTIAMRCIDAMALLIGR